MGLKTYNGFPGAFRTRQGARLRRELVKDNALPPECDLCGVRRAEGHTIHTHIEDYHAYRDFQPLCYYCHLALHRRYEDPDGWARWLDRCSRGWKVPQTGTSYGLMLRNYDLGAIEGPVVRPTPAWALDLPGESRDLYRPEAVLPGLEDDEPAVDYEGFARARKVARLLKALTEEGLTAKDLDKKARNALARRHGVNVPSDRTWAEVLASTT